MSAAEEQRDGAPPAVASAQGAAAPAAGSRPRAALYLVLSRDAAKATALAAKLEAFAGTSGMTIVRF